MCDFLVIFPSCHYHFSYAGSIICEQQPSRGIAKALVVKENAQGPLDTTEQSYCPPLLRSKSLPVSWS